MLMTANVSWSAKREKYYVEDSGRWREATHKDLHDIYPALPRDVWYGRNALGEVVSLDDPSMPYIPQPAPERQSAQPRWTTVDSFTESEMRAAAWKWENRKLLGYDEPGTKWPTPGFFVLVAFCLLLLVFAYVTDLKGWM